MARKGREWTKEDVRNLKAFAREIETSTKNCSNTEKN
jgi:predicted transcriptional regulator